MTNYYSKYAKYKKRYLNSKGGNNSNKNILLLPYVTINIAKDERNKIISRYEKLLKNKGNVTTYEFPFNNPDNKFLLNAYDFDTVADDIKNFISKAKDKFIVVCIDHASSYGLYTVDKYPDLFSGIICYPLRFYIKASLERRIWKLKNQGGWEKHISKKYDMDQYYFNTTDESIKILLKNPSMEELNVLQLISDVALQRQADKVPKVFNIPTILFTRLDMDIATIVEMNYERKSIADMKGIVSENDALYTSMMWNFDRIKHDKHLIDLNNNGKLKIRYFIGGMEDYSQITDAISLL